MQIGNILRYPLWTAQILSSTKSFARNPVLGNPRLNEMGLHVWRLSTAHRLAAARRARIARRIDPDLRAAFDRDGFFVIRDYLPPETWARLKAETDAARLPAREMREGQTVTRHLPLTRAALAALPETARIVGDPGLNDGALCRGCGWRAGLVLPDRDRRARSRRRRPADRAAFRHLLPDLEGLALPA